MHTKFCCLQLQPGVEPLPLALLLYCGLSPRLHPRFFAPPRFKSLLQNRPAAENTCIEISHVKYNIFHVRCTMSYLTDSKIASIFIVVVDGDDGDDDKDSGMSLLMQK